MRRGGSSEERNALFFSLPTHGEIILYPIELLHAVIVEHQPRLVVECLHEDVGDRLQILSMRGRENERRQGGGWWGEVRALIHHCQVSVWCLSLPLSVSPFPLPENLPLRT